MKGIAIILVVVGVLGIAMGVAGFLQVGAPAEGAAGLLSPSFWAANRVLALIIGVALLVAGLYIRLVADVRSLQAATVTNTQRVSLRRKSTLVRDMGAWFIMLPSVILFIFYIWEPLIESVRLSFYSTQGFRTIEFVGLDNYRSVFAHPDFWPSVRNTFMYTFWSLVIGFMVPIVMAVVINEVVYGKGLARTSIYLPNIVPGLATVFLWRFIFSADKGGGINMLLATFGLGPYAYLSNASIVIPIIVLTMTWKGAGATTLIYLAGLQSINPEYYEAAIIDGASVWQRIRHITVPNIYNLARTLLILQIISVFQILYEPMVMTNGGPNNASVSMMQVVYRYAFERFDYSRAAAMSVIISIALIVLTLLYNRLNRPQEM